MSKLYTFLVICCVSAAATQSTPAQTLDRYAACKLAAGPMVVETAPLASGVTSRPVKTHRGEEPVALEAGQRIMFAYPGEDFYANVKAERLPAATYEAEKRLLIESFDYTFVGSPDMERNYTLKPELHHFQASGADRAKLEGGVLGVYQLFDDRAREVLTIYFLNGEPDKRHSKTLAEYGRLRDLFLDRYTGCSSAAEPR